MQDLKSLARGFEFIHKPMYGSIATCDGEAMGILVASRSEPSVRYACEQLSISQTG
jgi:hypothetical protein